MDGNPTCRLSDNNKKCGCRAGYVFKRNTNKIRTNACGGRRFPTPILETINGMLPDHFRQCCNAHDVCYGGLRPIMKNGIVELDDAKQTPFLSEIDSDACDQNLARCQLSYLHTLSVFEPLKLLKFGMFDSTIANIINSFLPRNNMDVSAVTCKQDEPGKICMYDEATLTSNCDATKFPQLRCNNDPCTGEGRRKVCSAKGKTIFYDRHIYSTRDWRGGDAKLKRRRYHGPADLIHRVKRLHDEMRLIDNPSYKVDTINEQIKTLEANPLLRVSTDVIRPSRLKRNVGKKGLSLVTYVTIFIMLISPILAYMNLRGSTSTWIWFLFKYVCVMSMYVVAGSVVLMYLNSKYRDVQGCLENPGLFTSIGGGDGKPCDNLSYNPAQRTWTCWNVPCGLTKEETNKLESMIDQCHLNGSCDTIRGLLDGVWRPRNTDKTNIDCKGLHSLIKHGLIS